MRKEGETKGKEGAKGESDKESDKGESDKGSGLFNRRSVTGHPQGVLSGWVDGEICWP